MSGERAKPMGSCACNVIGRRRRMAAAMRVMGGFLCSREGLRSSYQAARDNAKQNERKTQARRLEAVSLLPSPLLGVGFSFVAKQKAGHGCGKLNCSKHFRLPEYNHDPPSCTLSVERHRWQAFSANEQADGRLLGVVEPRHDRSTVMFVD